MPMNKKYLLWAFLPLFLGVFWVALGSAPAGASTLIYSQNFDTLNLGSLIGQDSWEWVGGNNWQVWNNYYYSSGQSAGIPLTGTLNNYTARDLGQNISDGYYDLWFITTGDGTTMAISGTNEAWSENRICPIVLDASANYFALIIYGQEANQTLPGGESLPYDIWHRIQLAWRSSDNKSHARIYVNDTWQDWTDWYTTPGEFTGGVETFIIGTGYSSADFAIDDIKVYSGEPAPPLINNIWLTYPENDTYVFDFPDWHLNYQADGTRSALLFEVETYENSTSTPRRYLDQMAAAVGPSTSTFALEMAKSFTLFPGIPYFARAILKDYSTPCLAEDCPVLATSTFNYFQVATSIENVLILPPHPTTTTEVIECDLLCKMLNGLFVT